MARRTRTDERREKAGHPNADQRPELTPDEIADLEATELPSREAMSIIMPPGLGTDVAVHGPHERPPIEPDPQD